MLGPENQAIETVLRLKVLALTVPAYISTLSVFPVKMLKQILLFTGEDI